jgi:hypothetical protein
VVTVPVGVVARRPVVTVPAGVVARRPVVTVPAGVGTPPPAWVGIAPRRFQYIQPGARWIPGPNRLRSLWWM